ncbi:MAG: HEPN domain-containing protein [Treponema sp.]|nr:HEPN domain-containing protein [Treponema sp.]
MCCYLCQQSAEKALKGYLAHFTHEEPPYALQSRCRLQLLSV